METHQTIARRLRAAYSNGQSGDAAYAMVGGQEDMIVDVALDMTKSNA